MTLARRHFLNMKQTCIVQGVCQYTLLPETLVQEKAVDKAKSMGLKRSKMRYDLETLGRRDTILPILSN